MYFHNKDELLSQLCDDNACEEGFNWAKAQPDLQTILDNVKDEWRVWCLVCGYHQFAEKCNWKSLDKSDWVFLLKLYPEYSQYIDWNILNTKYNMIPFVCLLIRQPQFSEFCNFKLMSEYSWKILLKDQPQFANIKEELGKENE